MNATGVFAGIAFVAVQFAIAGWLAYVGERRMAQRIEASHKREYVTWTAQLDALAKSISYGQPALPPAVVADREPDVEERASRAFGEEALANGVVRLREEYALLGVVIPDEDLQREAASILFGGAPMPSIPLLVRDGPA